MEKSKVISKFDFFEVVFDEKIIKYEVSKNNEVEFPIGSKQIVMIDSDKTKIYFGLNNDFYNTKVFTLSKARFESCGANLEILEEIAIQFGLQKDVSENPDYYSYYLKNRQSFGTCKIAIQKSLTDKIYCILFATRKSKESGSMGEDYFSDDVVFISNISEIHLSEDIKKLLYN